MSNNYNLSLVLHLMKKVKQVLLSSAYSRNVESLWLLTPGHATISDRLRQLHNWSHHANYTPIHTHKSQVTSLTAFLNQEFKFI